MANKKYQRSPTKNQINLVTAYKENPNIGISELARKIGMTPGGVSKALESPNVKSRIERIREAMDKREELAAERYAQKLVEGLEATKVVRGEESVDYIARHSWFETAMKIHVGIDQDRNDRPINQILILNDIKDAEEHHIGQ